MLIDGFVSPAADVTERHQVRVAATPARTFRAVGRVDFARSAMIRTLFRLRGLVAPFGPPSVLRLEDFVRLGFVQLAAAPDTEVVLGVIGQFWHPSGRLQTVDPEAFVRFDEPGYAKAAWNFRVTADRGASVLSTQTRVVATDRAAARMLRLYWLGIGPFSKLIRRRMLQQIKATAEAG